MPTRFRRGRGHFTAPSSRSGRGYVYAGRAVRIQGDHFTLAWNGPVVMAELQTGIAQALANLSDDALNHMQSIVPVDTGALRDSCFVIVDAESGRIRVEIGATASYAVYVELGTSSHRAQPYIRPTYDFVLRVLPSALKSEISRRAR